MINEYRMWKGPERRRHLRAYESTVVEESNEEAVVRSRQIVHDLRQPAAAISALASAAQIRIGSGQDVREALNTIAKEADRISDMCGRLLDDSFDILPLRLDRVVHQVAERARTVFGGSITVTAEPCQIDGDELAWWRLVGNLVDNACRAAGERGEVALTVHHAPDGLSVEIEDSGPGFGRVPTNNGIGLSSVFRVVDWHGGHLELGRSRLGGANVRIVLPAQAPTHALNS